MNNADTMKLPPLPAGYISPGMSPVYSASMMLDYAEQAVREAPVQQEPVAKDGRDCPYCYHAGSVHCGDVKDKILANGGDLGYCSNAQVYGRRTPQPAQPQQAACGSVAALQRVMTRLADLLDEDQFAEIEGIVARSGVAPPAQRKPLTYAELMALANESGLGPKNVSGLLQARLEIYGRAIEAKHNIKDQP